jgi:hypothetical protein
MQIGTEMCSLEVGYSAGTKKCSHGFAQCSKAAGSRMQLVRLLHNLSNTGVPFAVDFQYELNEPILRGNS